MSAIIRPALCLMVVSTLALGLAYPLAITGAARLFLPYQAGGSLISRGGSVIGSDLIGQNFTSAFYFWPRPSATVDRPYNAGASSGTNLGPTSARLKEMVAAEVSKQRDAGAEGALPVDAATASGSGLDPDISVAYALMQAKRVAQARKLPQEDVTALVKTATEGRLFGLIGEVRVNVLKLNLALDALKPMDKAPRP